MIATSNMPGQAFTDSPVQTSLHVLSPLKNIKYTPLHPTFGAEVTGLDFSEVTEEKVREIKRALAIVCILSKPRNGLSSQYGVLVFRKTGLDDDRHVKMSGMFGDLDDIKPFVAGLGQINRLSSD